MTWIHLTLLDFIGIHKIQTKSNLPQHILIKLKILFYTRITDLAGCPCSGILKMFTPKLGEDVFLLDGIFNQPPTIRNSLDQQSNDVRVYWSCLELVLRWCPADGCGGGTCWRYWGVFFCRWKQGEPIKTQRLELVTREKIWYLFVFCFLNLLFFCVWPIDIPCDDAVFGDLP